MNWTKALFVLIIVLLYIPMVFLGANVFFTRFTGVDSYYNVMPSRECYGKYQLPIVNETAEQQAARQAQLDACFKQQQDEQRQFEKEKNAYDGNKYTFIALFNLIVIIVALVWVSLSDTIMIGLFFGSVIATFIASIRYFDTNSRIGFIVLVITFFTALVFINRKRAAMFDWSSPRKR